METFAFDDFFDRRRATPGAQVEVEHLFPDRGEIDEVPLLAEYSCVICACVGMSWRKEQLGNGPNPGG